MSRLKSIIVFLGSSALLPVVLTSCSLFGSPTLPPDESVADETQESSFAPVQDETKNVSYRGLLSEAGPSVMMEGTHVLTLSDGRSVSLESEAVSLAPYVGKEVEVMGDVRAAVEGGGLVMRVVRVVDLSPPVPMDSSASVGDEDAAVSDGSVSSSSASSSHSSASRKPLPIPTVRSSSVSAGAESSSVITNTDEEFRVRTAAMAKAKIDDSGWTQRYCTGHIGFCMPVQKNWWYKSFGANADALWYVELSSEEILSVGDGPIAVKLLKGDAGSEDGKVFAQGSTVLGVLGWTEGRHFEIRAATELRAAVEYILLHITPYTEATSSS